MGMGSLRDYKGKTSQNLFDDIIDNGLCVACGICVTVCPQDCFTMVGEEVSPGAELRQIANDRCDSCGICYACCPGERVDVPELEEKFLGAQKDEATQLLGLYRNRYVARATDDAICASGASAGTAAALQIYALEKGLIDGVLGVTFSKDKPWMPVPTFSTSRSEILATQGSKYTHCSLDDALKDLAKQRLRVGVVGLPCHIHGVRKMQAYMGKTRLAQSVVFTIGLFCAENRFTKGAEHIIERRMGVPLDTVAKVSYREGAYPGAFTVWDKEGKVFQIPYPDQLTFLWMHTRPRCRTCWDYAAEVADISLGETQHLDKKLAHNAALVRTDIGAQIFEGAIKDGYITVQDVEEKYIFNHTGLERKKYANLMMIEHARRHGLPAPTYPDSAKVRYEDLPPFYFGPKR